MRIDGWTNEWKVDGKVLCSQSEGLRHLCELDAGVSLENTSLVDTVLLILNLQKTGIEGTINLPATLEVRAVNEMLRYIHLKTVDFSKWKTNEGDKIS